MNWLARLKEKTTGPSTAPAEPTKAPSAGFVSAWEAPEADFGPVVNDPEFHSEDPDRWCWPKTEAMNSAEIERFNARVALFAERGIRTEEAEGLADALVKRDRETDDRRLCLECSHLRGTRCSVPAKAGAGAFVQPDCGRPGLRQDNNGVANTLCKREGRTARTFHHTAWGNLTQDAALSATV